MDTKFLLRFLRARKFSVPRACDMLENFLSMYQFYPKWFKNLTIDEKELDDILSDGYMLPLPQRDKNGCQVVWICPKRFNTEKFTSIEAKRIFTLITECIVDDEESQINGFVYIYDDGFPIEWVTMWKFTELKAMAHNFQHCTPMRYKEMHFVNVPSYAKYLMDFVINRFSEKLRNRVFFHVNREELMNKIDRNLLPKEYGGTIPLNEIIDGFRQRLISQRTRILANDNFKIDVTKPLIEDDEADMVGSFRTLEVD